MIIIPDKLRIRDGELVMADGSDVREYLRAFAKRQGITESTPISLLSRNILLDLIPEANPDERYALAS